MKKELSVAENTLYNTVGSVFYLICQWLITVLVIRISTVENGGILSLSMAVTNAFFSLSTFGIRPFQISDHANKYTPGEYMGTRVITCLFSFSLCLLYSSFVSGMTSYEAICVIVYMVFRSSEAISDVNQSIQLKAGQMNYAFWSFILRGSLMILSFFITLHFSGSMLLTFCVMSVTTCLAVLLFEYPICVRLTGENPVFHFHQTRSLLVECAPLMINSFLVSFCVTIPRTVLNNLLGNYWMGIYGSIAAPAAIMQSAAMWLYTPSIAKLTDFYYRKEKQSFVKLHFTMLGILGAVIAAILLGALFLGKWALQLVYGTEVATHSKLLIPSLIATSLIAGEYYYSTLLTIQRKMQYILITSIVGLILSILIATPIIQRYGVNGANLSVIISIGLTLLIQITVYRLTVKKHFACT